MPRGNKSIAQKQHALNRYAERFGKVLPPKDYRQAVQNIIAGNFEFVKRQSNRLIVFRGVILGTSTLMVYDCMRKRIVTFLVDAPQNSIRPGSHQITITGGNDE